MRAPGKKRGRRTAPATLFVRLLSHITLEARTDGNIVARIDGYSAGLGQFSVDVAERARRLQRGLALDTFAADGRSPDTDVERLVRQLARRGLVEYRLEGARGGGDQVVIEPQTPDYWPQMAPLGDADVLVLSRFAYLRRRGDEMVLESPRAGAVFKICNPELATALASLSTPQSIKRLRRQQGFPGRGLLALLVDCQVLFKTDSAQAGGPRAAEGDDSLVLWDFHDLLFHARSTEGRHANPTGGVYPYAGVMTPLPAVRQRWPGRTIELREFSTVPAQPISPAARLLHGRRSTRVFDDQRPITLAELARFLDSAARVQSSGASKLDLGDDAPAMEFAARPYPSGGASWELELYLAVDKCDGLARGFYHYDAGGHALARVDVPPQALETLLQGAAFAMGAPASPQILITITARFGRVSWKYSSIAYALILKDVGVLLQTFYLMATDMGLGGCAIGSVNIDLFAKMTGVEFHVEGPVGQFAIGRGASPGAPG